MEGWLNCNSIGSFSEGRATIKLGDNNFNFINKNGKFLSHTCFNYVYDFSEGFAQVEIDGKGWNFIDLNGKFISDRWFDRTHNFSDDHAYVSIEGKGSNFIDKTGKIISNTWFHTPTSLGMGVFFEGFAVVGRKNNSRNFINKSGELLSNLRFDEFSNFSEGYALIGIDGKGYNFISKSGDFLSNTRFDNAYDFSGGYACVRTKLQGYNFINKKGGFLFNGGLNNNIYDLSKGFSSEGYVAINISGKGRNFMDRKGQYLSDIRFSHARSFSGGYALVERGGLYNPYREYNFINKNGGFLSDTRFHGFRSGFSEDYAAIKVDYKGWNFIDKKGKYLSDTRFSDVGNFSEGYALINKKGQGWNFIDKKGKYLWNADAISRIQININQTKPAYKKSIVIETDKPVLLSYNKIVSKSKSYSNSTSIEKRKKIREKIFEKNGRKCSSCGSSIDLDVHHILPRHMGGKDILKNLQILCRPCHEAIHKYTIEDGKSGKKKPMSKKLTIIHEAMEQDKNLRIKYDRPIEEGKGEITIRIITPKELYYENGMQYLDTYCHLRKDRRCFRISRIIEIEIL